MNNLKQRLLGYLHGRNFPSTVLTAIVLAAVVFLNIIIYTLGSHFELYIAPKTEDDLSISDASDAIFAAAVEEGYKVKVTFCMYEDVISEHTTGKFVLKTARAFEERYPELIELRFVNILTQLTDEKDPQFFDFTPYQKDMKGNDTVLSRYSVIFECGSNYRVLTDVYTSAGFADFFTLDSSLNATSYRGEETFASMVRWVMQNEHKTAYFTTGHSESANNTIYDLLVSAGYYVEEINLRKVNTIPDDAGLLVISNPISDFEAAAEGSGMISEIERMRSYASRGGKFLVTLDPYAKKTPMLYGFLEEFGISVNRNENGDSHIVKDNSNAITTDGFTLVAQYGNSPLAEAMKNNTDPLGGSVIIRDVAAMSVDSSLGAKELLVSSSSSICQAAGETVNTDGSYVIAAYSELDADRGGAKMCVVPSVYFTAVDAMVTEGYLNKDFALSLCDELFDGGEMIYGCKSIVYDSGILENLTMGTARAYTAALVSIPVILCVAGAVVIVRRKNR